MLKKIKEYLISQPKDDGRYDGYSVMLKLLSEEVKEIRSKGLKKIDINQVDYINYNIRLCK